MKKSILFLLGLVLLSGAALSEDPFSALKKGLSGIKMDAFSPEKISQKIIASPPVFSIASWAASKQFSWWWLLLMAFFAGILISFTPCVYPLIPVTVTIMQRYATGSMMRQFLNAVAYVLGLALVYAAFGYASALYGVVFGSWLASWKLLTVVVLFYLYCAGAMFDFYEFYIPSFFLRQDAPFAQSGSLFSLFLYGMFAGTFASPCITPGLSLILGVVAQLKNPVLGFMMLFFFAIGMSFFLLLVSLSTKALELLPKSGIWMLEIKKILGFLLLFVAFSYVAPYLPATYAFIIQLFFLFALFFFYGLKMTSLVLSPEALQKEWGLALLYGGVLLALLIGSFVLFYEWLH